MCPQAMPEWALAAAEDGATFDGAVSEDCLFLDVIVSEEILEGRQQTGDQPGKSTPDA